MSTMASQITSLTIVYSIVYPGGDQRKHQSSASLDFVRGIHRWPVNSAQRPVTQKIFQFDDAIMKLKQSAWLSTKGEHHQYRYIYVCSMPILLSMINSLHNAFYVCIIHCIIYDTEKYSDGCNRRPKKRHVFFKYIFKWFFFILNTVFSNVIVAIPIMRKSLTWSKQHMAQPNILWYWRHAVFLL